MSPQGLKPCAAPQSPSVPPADVCHLLRGRPGRWTARSALNPRPQSPMVLPVLHGVYRAITHHGLGQGRPQGSRRRQRRGHADPALWLGGQSQHPTARPGAARPVPAWHRRRPGHWLRQNLSTSWTSLKLRFVEVSAPTDEALQRDVGPTTARRWSNCAAKSPARLAGRAQVRELAKPCQQAAWRRAPLLRPVGARHLMA